MTSKEALNNIKNILREDENVWEYNEDIKQIEKDLEVLEIIKKYLVRIFDYPEGNNYFYLELHKFISEKEGMKFKEWLENDSNKNKSVNSES